MPVYRVKEEQLAEDVAALEQLGEIVVQAVPDGRLTADGSGAVRWFTVVTNLPVNDTGFSWAPDRMRGGA